MRTAFNLINRFLFLALTAFLLSCNVAFSFVSSHRRGEPKNHHLGLNARKVVAGTLTQNIKNAATIEELLSIYLWMPNSPEVPSGYFSKRWQHAKRRQLGALWLTRLVELTDVYDCENKSSLWREKAFERAVFSAGYNYADESTDPTSKERRAIRQALVALYTLLRKNVMSDVTYANTFDLPSTISHAIWLLIERAEQMAFSIPLNEAVEVRWAARGLMVTLKPYANPYFVNDLQRKLSSKLPRLEKRVSALPFDILPRAVNFLQREPMRAVQQEILFHFDSPRTRKGSGDRKRWNAVWLARRGIDAVTDGGKLLRPHLMPTSILTIMREVELVTNDYGFYDCARCNWYSEKKTASRFHTERGHGAFHVLV